MGMDVKENVQVEISSEKKSELFKKMLRAKAGQNKVLKDEDNKKILTGIEDSNKSIDSEFNDIPEEYFKFELFPEYKALLDRKRVFEMEKSELAYFRANDSKLESTLKIGDKEYICFSGYNYLGFAGDRRVIEACTQAAHKYGTGASASRLITGERPIHRELEREIADLVGTEDAIVYVGGHTTNVNFIGRFLRPQDLIVYDYLSHNSITEGADLSGARKIPYPHNDYNQLEEILKANRKNFERVLIVIEGIYSQDGDIPDLPKIIELKKKYKANLMIDEAHSIGIIGNTGRGIGEYFGVDRKDVDIWMGTISKAFASCGGYIASTSELVEYLKYTSPGFIYTAGMSPANTAAALESIRLLKQEPFRVDKIRKNAEFFLNYAKEKGLDTGLSHDTPIIPIIIGNTFSCIKLSNYLFENGVVVNPIIFPAVPKNGARLRFFITTEHKEEQMKYVIDLMYDYLPR